MSARLFTSSDKCATSPSRNSLLRTGIGHFCPPRIDFSDECTTKSARNGQRRTGIEEGTYQFTYSAVLWDGRAREQGKKKSINNDNNNNLRLLSFLSNLFFFCLPCDYRVFFFFFVAVIVDFFFLAMNLWLANQSGRLACLMWLLLSF